MPPRTPDSFTGGNGEMPRNNEQREKAKKEVKQQLRKLMADVRTRGDEERRTGPDRNEKRLKELTEQIDRQQREVLATFALLLNPDGSLPEDLQKEFAAEFSDKQSAEFINNLINGDANRLSTDATNLGRSIDGQPPISRAANFAGRIEGRLSDMIDGFIQDRGIFSMISERTGMSEQVLAKQFQQVRPFLMNAIRGMFANIAENFKMIPGAQEFAIRTRVEGTWPALLKLKMQDQNIAKRIRARGENVVKELYINAMVGQAANRQLAQQAGQPMPTGEVTLESVLGITAPTGSPAPAPSTTEQGAKKEAAAVNRPLGAAETIQDMQMSFLNNEFRVQKGSDTFKATAKHGNDAATVTEVTPIRQGTGPVETLTIKTRKGTEDLTKTVRANDIKTALEPNGNKRVIVDNVTLEFTRV
jgi:hypothetical protein